MKINEYIKSNSMTKTSFAKRVGISVSTLEKYIYSKRIPSLKVAYTIVTATNGAIQFEDLLPDDIKIKKKVKNKLVNWKDL